jgi:ribokinase
MGRIPDIIVVNGHGLGEYCDVKQIPQPGETCIAYNRRFEMDAGKGTNVACAISRLGGDVAFVAKCGRDKCGELGYQWLTESNVDTSYYWMDPSIESCLGLCFIAENGENLLLDFDDDLYGVQPDEVERCVRKMKGARYLCSGFAQAVESGLTACRVGKELGMFTLLNPSPLRDDLVLPAMPYVDILCVNETESKKMLDRPLTEEVPYLQLAEELQKRYQCANIVMTLGANGCCAATKDDFWHIPGIPVKMVDETGAGDGFLAAMTYCLSRGRTLRQATEWANIYSAYMVTKSGSLEFYPWKANIPAIFSNLHKEDALFE